MAEVSETQESGTHELWDSEYFSRVSLFAIVEHFFVFLLFKIYSWESNYFSEFFF